MVIKLTKPENDSTMKLTHYLKEGEMSLRITVDFDPHHRVVEEVKSIYAVEYGNLTDITDLLHEYFSNDLDKLLEKIDWMQYVNEEKEINAHE